MRKIIISIFLLLALTSCLGDSREVIDAKKDLWIIEKTNEDIQNDRVNNDLSEDPRISIVHIYGERLLELDNLKYTDFKDGHAKISGKTLWFVEEIQVDFSNETSEYPNDSFVLKKFKSWDDTFTYNANSKFKVLDFGLNKYTFTATANWKKSILELQVLVSANDDEFLKWKTKQENNNFEREEETKTTELIWTEDDLVFAELPEWWEFGSVVKLWEKSFTYSDIKWLEIKKEIFRNISCDINEDTGKYFVTEFLGERLNSFYYWNTCRDLIKDKGVSFYVLRLDWDKYFYEKYYIDLVNWFIWTYELETWTWITRENISEKNKELREKNREFETTEIVDNLFKKIIKN